MYKAKYEKKTDQHSDMIDSIKKIWNDQEKRMEYLNYCVLGLIGITLYKLVMM